MAEQIEGSISSALCDVVALALERTFWEKATLLHAEAHRPRARGATSERVSRHCYDLAMLARTEEGLLAVSQIYLLNEVAEWKEVYWRRSWTHFDTARPGTLRLLPDEDFLPALRSDYTKMLEMLIGEPPDFDQILRDLETLEHTINRLDGSTRGTNLTP